MGAKAGRGTGIVAGIVGASVVTALAYGLLRPHDRARPQTSPQNADAQNNASPASAPPVTSAPAAPAPGAKPGYDKPAPLILLGTVLGDAQTISTRQPARIAQVLVKEGQAVRSGQLLALLELPETHTAQQSAIAGVQVAQAQANKAKAGRAAQLVKADADIQTAQAGVTQARERLHQAQTGVQAAQSQDRADLARAQDGVRKALIGLQRAQSNLKSLEDFSTVGGVARNDLEGARAQVTLAQSDLDTAQTAVQQIQDGPKVGVSNSAAANKAVSNPSSSSPSSSNPASSGAARSNPVRPLGSGGTGLTFRVANARQEADLAQDGVRQAQDGLRTARAARTQILAVADADVASAQAGVTQARAGLSGAQSGEQAARLTSSLNGIASSIAARVGETAQPGQPLIVIVSFANARIEALASARQIGQMQVGQTGQARLDTRPDMPLAIVVRSISRVAEPDGRAFRVTFRLLRPPSTLRVGQMARISIP